MNVQQCFDVLVAVVANGLFRRFVQGLTNSKKSKKALVLIILVIVFKHKIKI